MTKLELIQSLIERAELDEAAAREVVEALFSVEDGIIVGALKEGEQVMITGFGSFEARRRSRRSGRNPRTGAMIEIGPSIIAGFRPGKGLRESLFGGTHGTGAGAFYEEIPDVAENEASAAHDSERIPYFGGTHGSGEGV